MNPAERERRLEDLGIKVEQNMKKHGLDPTPAFLNVISDFIVDTEERLGKIEQEIKKVKAANKNHGWASGASE